MTAPTRLRRQDADPQADLASVDARVLALTADLAAAVAERRAVAEASAQRIAAQGRIARTVAEVAAACGVSRPTVERWTQLRDDPLPFSSIERGNKLILDEDVTAFIRRYRRNER